jgi:hypothetical protein
MLDIPGISNLLAIRVLYAIQPRSCNLVHTERPLPSRVKLVQPGFIQDSSKNHISDIKRASSGHDNNGFLVSSGLAAARHCI